MKITAALSIIALALIWCATWVTHVVTCITYHEWVLLFFGIILPPIGWIHGIMVWFGYH